MRLILLLTVFAGVLSAYDLQEVYELALQHDPSFQSSKEALKAGEEVEYQGYSVLMPKINLTSTSGYNNVDSQYKSAIPLFPNGLQKYNSSSYGANLIWPLLRKDSIDLYRGSKVLLREAKAAFEGAKQEILLRTSAAYFDLLAANDNMEFLQAQKSAVFAELEDAKLNFKLGNVTLIETSEAEARYDLLEAKVLQAKQDIAVKKDILEKITGEHINDIARLSDVIDDKIFESKNLDEIKQMALSSPTLKRAKEQAEFASLEYERTKAGFYPAVDAVAQKMRTSANGSAYGFGLEQTTSYIGLSLEFNIFNGGYDMSKTREMLAKKNQAKYDYEAMKQDNMTKALQSYLAVNIGLSQTKATKKALESAKLSLEAFKTGTKIGLRNSTELLNAEEAFYEAQKNYSNAKYSLVMSMLKLKAITNELGDDDIETINKFMRK